jgi:ABC-type bacteriocin/lantibiotic exporter with double-glycine peptidase domain
MAKYFREYAAAGSGLNTVVNDIGFHKYIGSLENSYEHIVGTGGAGISAGQRRMITLLRTLSRKKVSRRATWKTSRVIPTP